MKETFYKTEKAFVFVKIGCSWKTQIEIENDYPKRQKSFLKKFSWIPRDFLQRIDQRWLGKKLKKISADYDAIDGQQRKILTQAVKCALKQIQMKNK